MFVDQVWNAADVHTCELYVRISLNKAPMRLYEVMRKLDEPHKYYNDLEELRATEVEVDV